MVKKIPDIECKTLKEEATETTVDWKELLKKVSDKPLHLCFPKKSRFAKITDNTDYLEILSEFAKDPTTDKTFLISEQQQKFIDTCQKQKNSVKTLLWLRFIRTLDKIPTYCIDDYELLFCILTFVVPMKYAHRIAKCLLDEYETLENILAAPTGELQELLFRHDDVIMLLDLVYAVLRKYTLEYEQ